ncbi:aminodeoxychorismate/anthranilate synthase component II [Ancylomarina euxinus]|uniref:Aminodeoxychorismate/anthranilate synthase component II n=1 Tax=Ancylomarina euxinus TaxID=2283627 RepID=A0A425XXD8_9BACT|nr:aminodeoxychorismate/anthranilate synthase component II [Ancylomarina euxinus]MCZ4696110.1 aminodeoxychorismate/anthranilate synthase component II [Ancylomarina euxinus]MUP16519.1 aminodeoxychorismate/anthranilate synthase component II [Ancylomarina euxinus]RRG19332.1 aminodeoxychorismate/anthranilate synthase component II [Ancylomarina euxinus]
MKILVLDNYDSFTYNLVEYLRQLNPGEIEIHRNKEIDLNEIEKFDKILLSPGPGIPEEAGILKALIKKYAPTKSILGICLGHQAIAEVFGAELENPLKVYHGIASDINRCSDNSKILNGIPSEFKAGRYHSWNVSENDLPDSLEITCRDEDGMIMGLRHKQFDVEGIQFHPESILTPQGLQMIMNWLKEY